VKNLIKLIIFLVCTFAIFLVDNYIILGIVALISFLISIVVKVNFVRLVRTMINLLPFVVLTAMINVLLGSLSGGMLVGIRLILVCYITYMFKYILSPMQLANGIETLLFPFKKTAKDISLIISICVAFIPILSNELVQIKYALKSKGIKINFRNFKYILKPFFYGVLKKTNEVSYALKAKAYIED